MHNRTGCVGNIALGEISVDSPVAVFYGKGGGHDHEAWGIRIGNAFLQDFIVTIDFQTDAVTLERP